MGHPKWSEACLLFSLQKRESPGEGDFVIIGISSFFSRVGKELKTSPACGGPLNASSLFSEEAI